MTVLGVAAGVVGFFFLPLWIGSFPLPVSVLVAVAATGLLPRVCYRLTGSMAAAVAPVAAWFVTTLVLYLVPNPTYARPLRIISRRLADAGADRAGLPRRGRLSRPALGRPPAAEDGPALTGEPGHALPMQG